MRWRSSVCAASLLMALASPATGEDAADAGPRLELPAHRALHRGLEEAGGQLAPFTTDGCSGGMSSVWEGLSGVFPEFADLHGVTPPWEACCITHDAAYHAGGTQADARASLAARLRADEDLRACVEADGVARRGEMAARYDTSEARVDSAYAAIAQAMYLAVRLGGAPCSGLPWRWGYGYPRCWAPLR